MHMSDALLSPQVGAAMWGATALTAAYCAKKVRDEADEATVPLMGVAGAFVFAAQMLNFSIPGTGSSGHLGGGLLLAVLLGPHAAFLVMASVLTVQALFFADGGLLALGANVMNLGFFPAFVAFPLVYKRLVGDRPTARRLAGGSVLAAVVGLQLGALGVVLETALSGVSDLPLPSFLALMQPIHLGIGVVEGLITAGVLAFVQRAEPEILVRAPRLETRGRRLRPAVVALGAAALLSAAVLSWFASPNLDGLEWSIARLTGAPEPAGEASSPIHERLETLQEHTSVLPDYSLPSAAGAADHETQPAWPAVDAGTSVAGLVGSGAVLGLMTIAGVGLRRRARARARAA